MAGRQFFTAEEMLFSAHHASYKECLDAGVHCFIMAIDVSENMLLLCTISANTEVITNSHLSLHIDVDAEDNTN